MRALIVVLALTVVGLAVSIVHAVDGRGQYTHREGERFLIGALVADAKGGESAVYREKTSGHLAEYSVVQAPQLPPFAVPYKQIQRRMLDARGRPFEGPTGTVTYDHKVSEHGFLPLTAPEAPDALDRVWIIRAIRPDRLAVAGGKEQDCWRVDLIDPALPEGRDTVVAWVSTEIPVYGLMKWKRGGETWELQRGAFAPGGAR